MTHLHSLYIDPGTGSILFSVLVGIAASLYFLLRIFIQKIKFIILGGRVSEKNKNIYKYVIYCEGKQYYNVFAPILEQFELNKTEVHYFTSSPNDPVLQSSYIYIKPKYIGEGNRAFAYLNFITAEVVLMTTPGLGVFQLKRAKTVRHYSHVLHSPSDATTYRLFGIDYFDSILLTGDYQADDIRYLEKLRKLHEKKLTTVGCSYLDVYLQKIQQIDSEMEHQFTVLVSPSWGVSSLLSLYGESLLDPLKDSGWRIIIRPHPQSIISESSVLDYLHDRYANCVNIMWDYANDNVFSLKKADVMISDFSGIIFDYMFLFDRPVFYSNQDFDSRPYDFEDLNHETWYNQTIRETCIELRKEDFPNITELIKNAGNNESLVFARRKARDTAWQYKGEAGKRIYNFMTEIV